jgi:hypothetical protein
MFILHPGRLCAYSLTIRYPLPVIDVLLVEEFTHKDGGLESFTNRLCLSIGNIPRTKDDSISTEGSQGIAS